MKRVHVHLSVTDLAASRGFYTSLFGAEPSVIEGDYVKWLLDDPRVNFAISARGRPAGLDHLGIQAESEAELADLGNRMQESGRLSSIETDTVCCYAKGDKAWAVDPGGLRWEAFHTIGESPTYFGDSPEEPRCCTTGGDQVCC